MADDVLQQAEAVASAVDKPKRRRGRPPGVRQEPQTAFEERLIMDPTMVAAVETYVEYAEAAAKANEAKRTIKRLLKTGEYGEGVYRVGENTITVKDLHGGDFTIPSWVAKGFSIAAG